MKTKLLTAFEKWANWKSILALFTLQILFNLVLLPGASSSDAHNLPILDLQFWYTPQRAYEIIGTYPAELRQAAAITHLTIDIIYPIVYGLLISLLLIITFRRAFSSDSARRAELVEVRQSSLIDRKTASSRERAPRGGITDIILFIPWGGVLFDYLENIGLATMYLSYPTELIPLAWVTAVFTATKWTLIGIAFTLVLVGAVKLAFIKNRPKSN